MFVGKYMAEWIMYGEPSIDLWSLDIRRFIAMHNNKKYLEDRVKEVLGELQVHPSVHPSFRLSARLPVCPPSWISED